MAYRVTEEGRTPSYGVMGSRGTGDWLNNIYRIQDPADVSQVNPGAFPARYEVLAADDAMIYWIKFMNTAAIMSQVTLTINGVTEYATNTPAAAGTWYSIFWDPTGPGNALGASTDAAGMYPAMYYTGFEVGEILVEMGVVAGGACTIRCVVNYGIL